MLLPQSTAAGTPPGAIRLFPSEKRAEAGADPVQEQHGLHCHIRAAFDVARGFVDVILRDAGVRRCDVEQAHHQVHERDQQCQEDKPRNHHGDDDPDRRDRRPATDVTAFVEGGNVDQNDQGDDEERGQRDGEDDLPGEFPAMTFIRFVNRLRDFGFHCFYFSIFAPSGD